MGRYRVKTRQPRPQPSRREFLRSAAAASAAMLGGALASAERDTLAASAPASAPTTTMPWVDADGPSARVVTVRTAGVLHASVVDPVALSALLESGLQSLTRTPSPATAWRRLLGDAARILVKFNSVGAELLGTNNALAERIVRSLADAGWPPESVTLVECPEHVTGGLGCAFPETGWSSSIDLDGQPEPIAAYVGQCDAIINVSLLKTHQLAGMSGCMKNLSHAVIKRPARYHANHCAPYVGRVIRSVPVSSRLRLNIVNAVRIVGRNGPEAAEADVLPLGGLILGRDPLAVDTIGWSALLRARRSFGLNDELSVPYLTAAAHDGVGRWHPAEVEHQELEHEY